MTTGKIEGIKRVMAIQGEDGNWNYNSYMHGLYNGMEMVAAIAEGREPDFREAPEDWLEDRVITSEPVGYLAIPEESRGK